MPDQPKHNADTMTGNGGTSRGAFVALFLVVFVDMAGFGIIIPFLPFWAERFGATPDIVALLMTAYSVTQFIFAFFWGWLSDRWGRKPVLLISVFGSVVSFLWLGFANSLWMLFAARMLAGSMGANIAVAQAWVADVTPGESRAKGMGLLGAAFGMGFIFGPAIGGVLAGPDAANPDFRTPFLVGAGVSMLSLLLGLIVLREPARHRVEAAKDLTPRARVAAFAAILGHPAVVIPVLVLTVMSFVMSGVEATFALWGERQFAWGPQQTGYFLAYIGVCIAVVQGGLVGPTVRSLGEVRAVQLGLLAFIVGLGMYPVIVNLPLVLLSGFLIAAGLGICQPSLNSLISRNAPADVQGSVMGASQSAQSFARIFGPAFAGILFAVFGRHVPFVAGALLALLALAFILRMRRHATAPEAAE